VTGDRPPTKREGWVHRVSRDARIRISDDPKTAVAINQSSKNAPLLGFHLHSKHSASVRLKEKDWALQERSSIALAWLAFAGAVLTLQMAHQPHKSATNSMRAFLYLRGL